MKSLLTAIAVLIACGCSAANQDTSKSVKIYQKINIKTQQIAKQIETPPHNAEDLYHLEARVYHTLIESHKLSGALLVKQDSTNRALMESKARERSKDQREIETNEYIKEVLQKQEVMQNSFTQTRIEDKFYEKLWVFSCACVLLIIVFAVVTINEDRNGLFTRILRKFKLIY